jgi:hypothetical protein
MATVLAKEHLMYPFLSLPAVLIEKQIIHVATAQFLSAWQTHAEQEACPILSQHLATIVEQIRVLPRGQFVRFGVDRIVEDLTTDIRQ